MPLIKLAKKDFSHFCCWLWLCVYWFVFVLTRDAVIKAFTVCLKWCVVLSRSNLSLHHTLSVSMPALASVPLASKYLLVMLTRVSTLHLAETYTPQLCFTFPILETFKNFLRSVYLCILQYDIQQYNDGINVCT